MYYVSGSDIGIYYEEADEFVYFRWNTSPTGFPDGTEINFGAKLYKSGLIELFYGDIQMSLDKSWLMGISEGSGDNSYVENAPNKTFIILLASRENPKK